MSEQEYFETNRQLWNQKTPIHIDSDFYDIKGFLAGDTSLKPIEIELLGDIKGKTILHLQCHFGQDSLSLARMGAKVTGLDISDTAIEEAKKLNEQLGLDAQFVCCDVYSAKDFISEKFDIVFTTYGIIGWLPDMTRWADIVSHFIKPNGQFVFVELHPVVWMYNEHFSAVEFPYFNESPIIETLPGTYAKQDASIAMEEVGWNHPLSEVFSALIKTGLKIDHFKEYNYSSHKCFKGMIEQAPGEFIIAHIGNKIPMTYSLAMSF